jgi:hypothetical protein
VKCFKHPQSEAVGTCKYCSKGVCTECVRDTGIGISCSPECQEEVKSLKALVDRNKQSFPLVAKAHARNAILLALLGLAFVAFSAIARRDAFLFPYLLSFGVIMMFGAMLSFLMARKFSKAMRPQA